MKPVYFLRTGLVLVFGLLVSRPLYGAETGTNDLTNWPARTAPAEIGRQLFEYMLPRWQVTGLNDPGVQDFVGLLRFAEMTDNNAARLQLKERIEPLLKQFEADQQCLPQRAEDSSFGAVLLELYTQTKDARYLTSGKMLADRQWQDARTDGLSSESRFRADDMYLITTLQVQAFRATADPVYLDRAAVTLSAYCEKLQDKNGLIRHSPEAPHHWGRGNGLASAALATLLGKLPLAHPERNKLLNAYSNLMTGVVRYQSDTGMWRQLIDVPDSYAESSCTAMLTQSLAMGVRSGWLPADRYAAAARAGWLSLMDKVGNSGKVYQVSVAAEPSASADYYLRLPVQRGGREGQIAVLWCAGALSQHEASLNEGNH